MKDIPSWVCPLCEKRYLYSIEEHYRIRHNNFWRGVKRSLKRRVNES